MSDFDAIDSLLASVGPQTDLPDPEARRALREQAQLSKAQVARALGVSPSTVSAWEAGRDPAGEVRIKYAYLLDGLSAKLATDTTPETEPAVESTAAEPVAADAAAAAEPASSEPEGGDDVEVLTAPEPCVLCGRPAGQRVEGFAQHLDPAECPDSTAEAQPAPVADRPAPASKPSECAKGPARRAFQEPSGPVGLVHAAVEGALAEHQGDVEAATAALLKKAIPDAMRLLDETRKGARYDVIAHPGIPDILKKQTSRGADQIWEARPKWTRAELPPGVHEVTALDINGAYLSALKTHLPLGQLEHTTGMPHDRRRAGVHLITPPAWEHDAVLPNPIGERDEPGPLWVTEPTLRLLLRLSSPKYGLCEAPEVHESYTSGATENLLEKFRITLKDARDTAIADGDAVTLEYVKAMYSKFVSTMGESNYNRELYRPDWMHIIRSQAFANLWMKALKAHDEGLAVVRAMGTDELHVIGDWRRVFPEGRGVTEVKVKDLYSAGTDTMGEEQ
ncbi:helix-turn-helix domain-containing protein [Streptomyces uncialis]|uniref:helix-turn-helix domain-containing protein n=1 Tax=Streptomyces uncialis TaxID=1048205 RepID=UPI00225A2515|nr:helix-turn-helix transcriptional regulator [Streptomyces uncialis]MCX4657651.1 helix-turn-helix transcriptional regulator [Streptomyces uncialis]MCX4661538.1 helix-turn-helix transcriptional regulator [Streptomyces uncialis]